MQSSPEVWKEFFETYYRDELNRAAEKTISLNGSNPINVDFLKDLVIFKEGIVAEELLDYPDIVLDHANHGVANSENIHNVKLDKSQARVYNLPISRRVLIRDLRSEHISKLVSIDGVVRKVTEVRPRVVEAAFVCSSCAVKMFIPQEDSTIKYPYECKSCGSKKFLFLPEESKSIDSQRMRIQEYPENLRGGEQPQTLDVVLENDLTGIINPGDRVVINGIVRATPRSLSGKRLRHMDITLEGNSIEVLQQEYEEFEITKEDKKKILEIGNDPEIYEKIVRSIAPVIYGYEDMKMAVALQLFGGIPKKLPDGTEIRGDVHVLLVGDPGVAKSQLLRYVHRIAPRSVYTTGKGTTSAGLCVAPESLIFGESNAYQIGELVESSDLSIYQEGIYRSKLDEPIKVQTINPTKTSFKPSNTLWKIRSPEKLIKIRSQTGKEVMATPNTKILVTENGEIKWKKSGEIKESDFIATARKLDHKGEKVPTLELIKDLNVTVYGAEKLVKDLIATIKSKNGLTTRELANKLGVNENNLYHFWVKESAVGSIDLKTLIKLAEEAEYNLEDVAQVIESFSPYHGHKIKLPTYLNERFLYFAGLIAGDGDVSRSSTGGYVIRFSNIDPMVRRDFMELTEELFGIKTKEESDGVRIPSIRFGSKIVATILKRLGIPESPKSHMLHMSEILLSLPNKELAAYVRGLFDCDGSIMVRKSGSSCIEFDTTSKSLAEKLHLSLLRFGIISYIRERKCTGEVTELDVDGNIREITKRHNRYELKLYGKNIERFNEEIGVGHPVKSEKLHNLLTEIGIRDTDNTIANLGGLIKEIRTFYGLSIKEVYGSNIGHLIENDKRNVSTNTLRRAVETLKTVDLSKTKTEVSDELRIRLGELISSEELNLSRERFYEYFKRQNRPVKIPVNLLFKTKEKTEKRDKHVHDELSSLLDNLAYQERAIQEKLEHLNGFAYSDIVWEKIKEKQEIQSPYEYVYDLTVDGSHSFLANGIVVHNTATATKDEYDGRWTLEAGALVLADKGIALVDEIDKMRCVTGDTLVQMADGSVIPIKEIAIESLKDGEIEELPNGRTIRTNGETKVLTMNGGNSIETRKVKAVHEYNMPRKIFEVKLQSGESIRTTAKHPFIVFKEGRTFKKAAKELKDNDWVCIPKKLPTNSYKANLKSKASTSDLPPSLGAIFGYICGDGNTFYDRDQGSYGIKFTNKEDELIEDFKQSYSQVFGKEAVVFPSEIRTDGVKTARLYGKEYLNKLIEDGVDLETYEKKRVPKALTAAPLKTKAAFIRALADSEGWVTDINVKICSTSYELLLTMKVILLEFGISSQIQTINRDGKKVIYVLAVTSKESLERFCRDIGFKLTRKQEALEKVLGKVDGNRTIVDVIPECGRVLHQIRDQLRLFQSECGLNQVTYLDFESGNANLSLQKAELILREFEGRVHRSKKDLDRLATNDLTWRDLEKISSIYHISQKELADKLGTYQQYISANWGREEIKKEIIEAIYDVVEQVAETDLKPLHNLSRGDIKWRRVSEVKELNYSISDGKITILSHRLAELLNLSEKEAMDRAKELLERKANPETLEEIKLMLAKHNITLQRVAEKIGTSSASISRWFNHRVRVDNEEEIKRVALQLINEKRSLIRELVMELEYRMTPKVYDLTVDGTHNFIANGMVIHNSEDRGGLHEAMEQQSYHPSFEITLSDGSKHKIGQLVDDLFDEYPERRINGIDCEILDARGLDVGLLTTDFKETFRTKADRVSRHKAPDYFVKIKYSNGREVTVTPEHPVFVFRNGEIVTEEASQIKPGEFVPSVKNMDFSGEEQRWLKIREIEHVPNEGEYRTDWVYDVTVEPTHNFISHGMILHNTVSVAKAGINAVLWARCAMLGAANPKYGRFDRYAPVAEQIDLSPTLLSRFDLIFVMTDDPDESRDRALAKHILDSHELGEKLEKLKNIVSTEYDQNAIMSEAKKIEPAIDPELLRKYIAYSKRTVFPVLTREVKQTIEDFYSSLRSQAKENTPMPVTARQLEALIRLAEASARLQLKDKVTIEDVNRVISIVRKSLEQIAVDPETGEMDIDYAFSGTSKTQRDRIMVIKKIVEDIAASHEKGAPEDEVLNSAEEQGINWNKAKEILQKMRMNGEVYCPKPGYFDITHNY